MKAEQPSTALPYALSAVQHASQLRLDVVVSSAVIQVVPVLQQACLANPRNAHQDTSCKRLLTGQTAAVKELDYTSKEGRKWKLITGNPNGTSPSCSRAEPGRRSFEELHIKLSDRIMPICVLIWQWTWAGSRGERAGSDSEREAGAGRVSGGVRGADAVAAHRAWLRSQGRPGGRPAGTRASPAGHRHRGAAA